MHYLDNFFKKKIEQSWSWLAATFLPKRNFLVNLNVKFMYQLYPIMLPKISQISLEWVMNYKVT